MSRGKFYEIIINTIGSFDTNEDTYYLEILSACAKKLVLNFYIYLHSDLCIYTLEPHSGLSQRDEVRFNNEN